jgi:uncharacterized protein YyaL (SSP411 family)
MGKSMMIRAVLGTALCAACVASASLAQGQNVVADAAANGAAFPFRDWGEQAMETIERDLRLPGSPLYAEAWRAGTAEDVQPAFMWGAGVQLSALAAAAAAEPQRYTSRLRSFADALQGYWTVNGGIGGFDVLPGPKPVDRYYDDNVWIVLALAETYELTLEAKYLEQAEAAFRFVMSGEDDLLGGGLYWHEQEKESKNTCSNAPAVVAALRLYQLTERPQYLDVARRLYQWTNRWLQDPADGLFWDNVKLNAEVDRRKYSYNSALMIRANALFHAVTADTAYLAEAHRIARSAEVEWVDAESGGIADGGRFAHMLLEAFLALDEQAPDPRWSAIAHRALAFVHGQVRDPNGRYASRWNRTQREPLREFTLLDGASAARAYWVMAGASPEGQRE